MSGTAGASNPQVRNLYSRFRWVGLGVTRAGEDGLMTGCGGGPSGVRGGLRGRRREMEPWVWVIIAVAAVLVLLMLFRRTGSRRRTVVTRRR
jgi:hypothetical protein